MKSLIVWSMGDCENCTVGGLLVMRVLGTLQGGSCAFQILAFRMKSVLGESGHPKLLRKW